MKIEQAEKMLIIAEDVFKGKKIPVSIGTRHPQTKEPTVLIGGRVEYNSFEHRRDAWDVALKYNIYYKKTENGMYEAGVHDEKDKEFVISDKPTVAVSEMAYKLIKRKLIS